MSDVYIRRSRRATPPTPGSALRQLRLEAEFSQKKIAQYYSARGVTVGRISQIEGAPFTSKTVEACYRAAVDTAVTMRDRKFTPRKMNSRFENPKLESDGR